VRGLFADLAREAGIPDPEGLARQLHLSYDGASLSARMDHDPSAAAAARAAAAVLLDAAPDAASHGAATVMSMAQPAPLEDAGCAIDLSAAAGRPPSAGSVVAGHVRSHRRIPGWSRFRRSIRLRSRIRGRR
jgi:hypothetical protein